MTYADTLERTYKTYRRLHKPTATLLAKVQAARTAELVAYLQAHKRVSKKLSKQLCSPHEGKKGVRHGI